MRERPIEERLRRVADRFTRIHQVRAPIVIGDNISIAIAAGRWSDARRWLAVRQMIWDRQGMNI